MSKATAAIMALFIIGTAGVSRANAQANIDVQALSADYSFGQHITFHLKATALTPITEVNLFFRTLGQTDTTAVPVPIEPGPEVSIDYAHSLVGQNIPPFAHIIYWWEVHDQTGGRAQSQDQLLYYADNRYDWQFVERQENSVHWGVYWVKGDVVFGQTALNIAVKSLDDINRELKAPVPGDVRIYVYPSEADLRSALNLSGYDWAGGQARPELGAILVGIPDSMAAPGEMERFIPHELTHLLVYHATGQMSGRVPPWLNEGLASLNERRPDPNRQDLVEQALAQDRLIPLEALCGPFPLDENAARLAYAQSASVVGYLREEYAGKVIRDLLAAYADNAGCDAGVTRVLNQNLEALDSAWRADLAHQGQAFVALKDSAVWLALWILTALLVLPLVGRLRRKSQ